MELIELIGKLFTGGFVLSCALIVGIAGFATPFILLEAIKKLLKRLLSKKGAIRNG